MLETFSELTARLTSYEAYLGDLRDAHERRVPFDEGAQSSYGATRTEGPRAEGQAAHAQAKHFGVSGRGVLVPEMLTLPAGRYLMGATPNDPDCRSSELPQHEVVIASALAVSVSPITFEQWDACLADGGTKHRPEDHGWGRGNLPVINVSWHDTQEYIGWLNRRLDLPAQKRFRLLTEAEWEYAARAGHDSERFPWGEDLDGRQLNHYAWHYGNSDGRIQPVGGKPANAFGFIDLLGNVAEWVQDHYSADYQAHTADGRPYQEDSRHAFRVLRGGSWMDRPRQLRPADRDRMTPDHRSYKIGFRVARNI